MKIKKITGLQKAVRFYHTVKYLRWKQIWFRLFYKFLYIPEVLSQPCKHEKVASFVWNIFSDGNQALFENDKVKFLGEWGLLATVTDWNNPNKSKLWLYNAHYFDDLNYKISENNILIQRSLVLKWIKENPPFQGNGWEPYPLSLRTVNWIKWLSRQNDKGDNILISLQQQTDALMQQIEYHLLGNHLLANAKALVFAGTFFEGNISHKYLNKGLEILEKEIPEQFLDDGGHFELSPMYHAILLSDLIDLIHLAQISENQKLEKYVSTWIRVAEKGLLWLKAMTHADGEIAFFNDAAMNVAPSLSAIEENCKECGVSVDEIPLGLYTLSTSGYSRISQPDHALLFDHAAVGPNYIPGHGHADTLSVEWSVGEQRVLVNSGTSLYGDSGERLRQRKTHAHNTLVIDQQDSSEVWGGFRIARRATANLIQTTQDDNHVKLVATHNGYIRLKGRPVHRRTVISSESTITIHDTIEGKYTEAFTVYHLHPDVRITSLNSKRVKLELPNQTIILVESDHNLIIEDATWHPEFGIVTSNKRIIIEMPSSSIKTEFSILNYN